MISFQGKSPVPAARALFASCHESLLFQADDSRLSDGRAYVPGDGKPECVEHLLRVGLVRAGTRNKSLVNLTLMLKSIGWSKDRVHAEIEAWSRRLPSHLTGSSVSARVQGGKATVEWAFSREDTSGNCDLMRSCGAECPGESECPFVVMPGGDRVVDVEEKECVPVTLAEACRPEFSSRPISFSGVPVAVDPLPQLVPSKVRAQCSPVEGHAICEGCPVRDEMAKGVDRTFRLRELLRLSSLNDEDLFFRAFKRFLRIPSKCPSVAIHTKATQPLLLALIQPSVNGAAEALRENRVYVATTELDDQTPYRFEGVTVAHPKSHTAVQVARSAMPLSEGFRSFEAPEDLVDRLRVFQPPSWGIADVMEHIAGIQEDWTHHVHRIYGRETHALLMSLPWLCPLEMMFGDRKERAWLEILAFGDTGQGKTEIAQRFLDFFGQGTLLTGKNVSVAGLLAGVDRVDGRHVMRKGIMPRYDGSLVVIDEWGAVSDEVARAMTDKRSSGVARVSKIVAAEFHARNRLLLLANPILGKSRRSCTMDEMPFGIQHVLPLMRSPEDVRRLDYVVGFQSNQRIYKEIHKNRPPPPPPVYTQDLAQLLCLWIWSRKADQVLLDFDAEEGCISSSEFLSGPDGYSPSIPLYMPGDSRHKVARVAHALAGMTFSTDDGINLKTRSVHVDIAHQLINRALCGQELQFDLYSSADTSNLHLTWDVFFEVCLEIPRWGSVDVLSPLGTMERRVLWPQAIHAMLSNPFVSPHDLKAMSGLREPDEFLRIFLSRQLMDKNLSGFKLNGRGVRVAKMLLRLSAEGINPITVTEQWFIKHKEDV